jgi:hypothetical protein
MKKILLLCKDDKIKNKISWIFESNNSYYLESGTKENISKYDIIYCPDDMFNIEKYKDKKFVFGPFLDFFPPKIVSSFTSLKNCIVLHEFNWKFDFWKNLGIHNHIPMKCIQFPIDPLVFDTVEHKNEDYFVYFNKRKEGDLHYLKSFMSSRKISNYKVFYEEDENFFNYAKKCKMGIILTSIHTNVITKLLFCNVPLLVWNMRNMSDDHSYQYPPIKVNNIEIWNACCGESILDCTELGGKFDMMLKKYDTYSPKDYIFYNVNKNKFIENFTNIEDSLIIEKCIKEESVEKKEDIVIQPELISVLTNKNKNPKDEKNKIEYKTKPKKRSIFSAMFRI